MERIEADYERALAGDSGGVAALIDAFTPILHVRAVRALVRRERSAKSRDLRQDTVDLVQDVLCLLFADDARVLRAWDKERGLSLLNYVGLVAEREVGHILRSARRNPYVMEPTEGAALERASAPTRPHDDRLASRELVHILWQRMEAELTPKGFELFCMLILDEQPVEHVCAQTGLKPDAVYAWRSRLLKRARSLLSSLENDEHATSETVSSPPTPLGIGKGHER